MTIKKHSRFHRSMSLAIVVLLALAFIIPSASKASNVVAYRSYIVQGTDAGQVARLVEAAGGKITSRLDVVNGVGALISPQVASDLAAQPGISSVFPNAIMKVEGRLDEAGKGEGGTKDKKGSRDGQEETGFTEAIGTKAVWSQGILGNGVTVAVMDSGLGWHQDLFNGTDGKAAKRMIGWVDFVDGSKKPVDPYGHGSHVAGVIASSQVTEDGGWGGIAPDVELVGVRVADDHGSGSYENIIQGIQWVIDHQAQYRIRVLNFSMSAQVVSPYWADPVNQALMAAWQAGIVVVTSAGNGGPGPLSIGVPGNNPYLITVGAFTDAYTPYDWSDDYIPTFSSAGPTYDGFVKPDLVAPGGHIVSTMLPQSYLAKDNPEN